MPPVHEGSDESLILLLLAVRHFVKLFLTVLLALISAAFLSYLVLEARASNSSSSTRYQRSRQQSTQAPDRRLGPAAPSFLAASLPPAVSRPVTDKVNRLITRDHNLLGPLVVFLALISLGERIWQKEGIVRAVLSLSLSLSLSLFFSCMPANGSSCSCLSSDQTKEIDCG